MLSLFNPPIDTVERLDTASRVFEPARTDYYQAARAASCSG